MMMLTVSPKAKPVRASFWVATAGNQRPKKHTNTNFRVGYPYLIGLMTDFRGDAGISEPQGFCLGPFLGREAKHETRIQPVL